MQAPLLSSLLPTATPQTLVVFILDKELNKVTQCYPNPTDASLGHTIRLYHILSHTKPDLNDFDVHKADKMSEHGMIYAGPYCCRAMKHAIGKEWAIRQFLEQHVGIAPLGAAAAAGASPETDESKWGRDIVGDKQVYFVSWKHYNEATFRQIRQQFRQGMAISKSDFGIVFARDAFLDVAVCEHKVQVTAEQSWEALQERELERHMRECLLCCPAVPNEHVQARNNNWCKNWKMALEMDRAKIEPKVFAQEHPLFARLKQMGVYISPLQVQIPEERDDSFNYVCKRHRKWYQQLQQQQQQQPGGGGAGLSVQELERLRDDLNQFITHRYAKFKFDLFWFAFYKHWTPQEVLLCMAFPPPPTHIEHFQNELAMPQVVFTRRLCGSMLLITNDYSQSEKNAVQDGGGGQPQQELAGAAASSMRASHKREKSASRGGGGGGGGGMNGGAGPGGGGRGGTRRNGHSRYAKDEEEDDRFGGRMDGNGQGGADGKPSAKFLSEFAKRQPRLVLLLLDISHPNMHQFILRYFKEPVSFHIVDIRGKRTLVQVGSLQIVKFLQQLSTILCVAPTFFLANGPEFKPIYNEEQFFYALPSSLHRDRLGMPRTTMMPTPPAAALATNLPPPLPVDDVIL